ncbi:MAG: hypothetical protein AW07_02510 [Candidatus Accumulibacter sp. SK-11]|nr:MAG: hypothetical protein AW07_02510 [Candidatus Accumulibacter sp. SK-11]
MSIVASEILPRTLEPADTSSTTQATQPRKVSAQRGIGPASSAARRRARSMRQDRVSNISRFRASRKPRYSN